MIFYADTVGLTTPDEGIISAVVEIDFGAHNTVFSLETRKFGNIFDSTLVDGFASTDTARIADGQIGSSTELVNGKAFYTSDSELFHTKDAEVLRTADTADIGFLFNLTEEKSADFIAFYVNSITGSSDVKLYGANSQFILTTSASKNFITSDGDIFITADEPNDFFGEISSFTINSTGWKIFNFSEVSFRHFLVQFSGSFTINLGEILIGQKVQPSVNPAMNRTFGTNDNILLKESYDGTEYALKRGNSAISRNFLWDAIQTSDKTSFERLRDKSHHKKFVYYDDTNYYFVLLDKMDINEVASGLSSVNLTFDE